jgi:hypothetical protein
MKLIMKTKGMKKILTLSLLIFLLVACGSSKTVRQSKKIMKGNWILSQVTHNETGKYAIDLLDDAPQACFEGSVWQFIPNNNSGNYVLSSGTCDTENRYFIFTIKEIDPVTDLYDFLLKPTDIKGRSETNSGYRLRLSQLSDTNMQWQQTVNVNGNPFTLNMNFIKQ